jgi:ABC-2 type transport system ATP-binding protein
MSKIDGTPLAIETFHLTKRYGKREAVRDLNLQVPTGSVYAFLGRNGAGKTTTIRMLLNLLDSTSGSARVLGMDSTREALEIKKRTGYVAEGQRMYDWMTVDETIWFCKGFYSTWDDSLAADLKNRLELDGGAKVGQLSRGTQAKVALLVAMAFHPDLLILDEPTAGLDVVVRRDFIEGVIELIQEQGRTVFFSSHLVHEVERVADWVGVIEEGHLVLSAPIEELKSRVKQIVLTFDRVPLDLSCIPGVLAVQRNGRQAVITVRDFSDTTLQMAHALGPSAVTVMDLPLEDIFVALVGKERSDG